MGRRLLEIKTFTGGVVGNADGKDLDPNSASISLNIDPRSPFGMIRGSRENQTLSSVTSFDGAKKLAATQDVSKDLLLTGVRQSSIRWMSNYLTSPSGSSLTVSVEDSNPNNASINSINNEVYFGLGSTSSTPPAKLSRPFPNQRQYGSTLPNNLSVDIGGNRPPLRLVFNVSGGYGASSLNINGTHAGMPSQGVILVRTVPLGDNPPTHPSNFRYVRYTSKSGSTISGLTWSGPSAGLASGLNAEYSDLFFSQRDGASYPTPTDGIPKGVEFKGKTHEYQGKEAATYTFSIFNPTTTGNSYLQETITLLFYDEDTETLSQETVSIATSDSRNNVLDKFIEAIYNLDSRFTVSSVINTNVQGTPVDVTISWNSEIDSGNGRSITVQRPSSMNSNPTIQIMGSMMVLTGGKDGTLAPLPLDAAFPIGSSWAFGVSYTYDYSKESPITLMTRSIFWSEGDTRDADPNSGFQKALLNLNIHRNQLPRVTSINVYIARRKGDTLSDDEMSNTAYQKNIPFESILESFKKIWEINIEEAPSTISNNVYFLQKEIDSTQGSSYEDNSGISMFVRNSTLHYRHGVSFNSRLYVGNIYNPNAPTESWQNFIARSHFFSYESFDWANNYVVLPQPVEAMSEFGGRIYAFDSKNMYRINPEAMFVEDVISGVTPVNSSCLTQTPYGLFILTRNHLYIHDGSQIRSVSEVIEEVQSNPGYGLKEALKATNEAWTCYDEEEQCVIMYVNPPSAVPRLYCYSIIRQEWTIHSSIEYAGAVTGHNSRVIASRVSGNQVHSLFSAGSRRSWEWESHKLSMGEDSQIKKLRKVTVVGDDITSVEVQIDDDSWISADSIDTHTVGASHGNTFKAKITGGGSGEARSLKVLYRDRGGFPK